MPRALTVCSTPGCPQYVTAGGRCAACRRQYEQQRGTFRERGYQAATWDPARAACLQRDPICQLCHTAPSQVADHWPTSRRDLIATGVTDPDALHRLRGLCIPCHNRHTALTRGGG